MALEVDDLSFDLHVSFNYTPQWCRKQFESWGGGGSRLIKNLDE